MKPQKAVDIEPEINDNGGGSELRYGERSFAGKPMTTALCREVQLLPQARVSENLTCVK